MPNPRLDRLPDDPFTRLASLLENLSPGAEPITMHIGEPRHPIPNMVPRILNEGPPCGNPDLVTRFVRMRSCACAGMPLPVVAAATALWSEEEHVTKSRQLYRDAFDNAAALIGDRFGVTKPAGGFFPWLEVGDGLAAIRHLWQETDIRVLPGRFLAGTRPDDTTCGDTFIRIALVHDHETTFRALKRLVPVL